MPPYQERVVEERDQLAERTHKLHTFLGGVLFDDLPGEEKVRLRRQHIIMRAYLEILDERIAAFTPAAA